jgi:glutamate racemase
MIGPDVQIVDSASAVAREVASFLGERDLISATGGGTTKLLVTDLPKSFDATASRFLGADVPGAEQVDL